MTLQQVHEMERENRPAVVVETTSTPLRRGPWSPDEDQRLMELISVFGAANWVRISQSLLTRTPKQCRERYHQNLKPSLNRAPITPEEGVYIEELVAKYGKRWAEIARHLNGRSDNAVKNWWNGGATRRRRVSAQPNEHRESQVHLPPLLHTQSHDGTTYPMLPSSSHHALPQRKRIILDECQPRRHSAASIPPHSNFHSPRFGTPLPDSPNHHSRQSSLVDAHHHSLAYSDVSSGSNSRRSSIAPDYFPNPLRKHSAVSFLSPSLAPRLSISSNSGSGPHLPPLSPHIHSNQSLDRLPPLSLREPIFKREFSFTTQAAQESDKVPKQAEEMDHNDKAQHDEKMNVMNFLVN